MIEVKTCFMFGHSDTPNVFSAMIQALDFCYGELGIRRFVVGSRGQFDRTEAPAGLKYLKNKHDDIEIQQLIAYHPALGCKEQYRFDRLFDSTYYPGSMERTPNAAAIRKANECMVKEADFLICYVTHPGNTRNLLEYAKGRGVSHINLAEQMPV